MSPTEAPVAATRVAAPATTTSQIADPRALIAMLHEKDRHIVALEEECRGLAEQLKAFQAEIVRWVELDR